MLGSLQQLEKADQERFELQKRIRALESGSALAAQKVCLQLSLSIVLDLFLPDLLPPIYVCVRVRAIVYCPDELYVWPAFSYSPVERPCFDLSTQLHVNIMSHKYGRLR